MSTELLREAAVALNDWIVTFAEPFADEKAVEEAHQRIMDRGGTVYYAAELRGRILKHLEGAR